MLFGFFLLAVKLKLRKMDVFKNASNPYIASTRIFAGNAQLVTAEVIVSKLLRKILGMSNRSFGYLAAVHAASLPLIGGMQAPFSRPVGYGPPAFYSASKDTTVGTNLDIIKGAAASVPAVWAAEYIVNTSGVGFHVPRPSIRDALMTAASKMLTRPLIGMSVNTILPQAMRANFEDAQELEMKYNLASNIRVK